MILSPGRQSRGFSVKLIINLIGVIVLLGAGALGCDIINGKPSIIKDVEKEVEKEFRSDKPAESGDVEYKSIDETATLKVIAVSRHADLKALGRKLANETKDKSVFNIDIYDDEKEARSYKVRFDQNITPEDAAFEDNEEALVAIYRKDTSKGENYITIYRDISHEDVETIRF